jgi:hypothetical protein
MARNAVYRSFEVHEGFGSIAGPLRFESESRAEADTVLERLAEHGSSAQLVGIRSQNGGADGESVLLRILLGQKVA